jgi:hypothetical protein
MMPIEFAPPNLDAKKLEEMRQRYRNVFGSEEGRLVLGDILVMCHFGVPLNSEEERHEYNVGVAIARMCAIMSEVDSLLGIRGG